MKIEKILNEKANVLMIQEQDRSYMNYAYAKIFDAEGDEIECSFLNDGCVTIDTSGLEHIVLTKENLNTLKKLLSEADKFYDKA